VLKALIRALTPEPLRRALRRARVRHERLLMWDGLERDLSGVEPSDIATLADTIAAGRTAVDGKRPWRFAI